MASCKAAALCKFLEEAETNGHQPAQSRSGHKVGNRGKELLLQLSFSGTGTLELPREQNKESGHNGQISKHNSESNQECRIKEISLTSTAGCF